MTALTAPSAGPLAAPSRPVGDVPTSGSRTVARIVLGAVAMAHGLVHLIGLGGAAADDRVWPRVLWAAAAAGWLAAGLGLATGRRRWWLVGAPALVVSQLAIATSWTDARAGTVANAVLLLAVLHGRAAEGSRSLRALYRREAGTAWASVGDGAVDATPRAGRGPDERALVTEADLAPLPPLVAEYLRRTGAVGRPRVGAVRVAFSGRMRSGPDRPWMTMAGEQVNTYGAHVTRRALFDASLHGVPIDGLHLMADGRATMQIRPAGLLTVVDAAGPEMDRGETVTVLNDLCFLAPAALLDADVTWHPVDERTVGLEYRLAGRAVRADLVFDQAGDLVDFVSDDRLRTVGRGFVGQRWSTPLADYRQVAGRRVAHRGAALWWAPEGPFAYIELQIDAIDWR